MKSQADSTHVLRRSLEPSGGSAATVEPPDVFRALYGHISQCERCQVQDRCILGSVMTRTWLAEEMRRAGGDDDSRV
jgi:hypothetical protein